MVNSPGLKKFVGLVFILLAVSGMLLALIGIVQVWRLHADLSARLVESLDLTASTLDATGTGLDNVSDSLENTAASLALLQRTSETTVQTISETMLLLETVQDVVTTELPDTISAVQDSLATAEQGAGLIDDVLRVLTRIPFISNVNYNPSVPLDQSIAEISDRLSDIPDSLFSTGAQLESTRSNLLIFQDRFPELAEQLSAIEANLLAMQDVVGTYRKSLNRAINLIEDARQKAPGWLRTTALVLTLLLFWLAFALTGPLLHGWQFYQQNQTGKTGDSEEI